MSVDLRANPKQWVYFCKVIEALLGHNEYRNFFYGGAIRGGKTYVSAAILLYAGRQFPNTRWHVVRRTFKVMKDTTIPTFEKIVSGGVNWKWNRDPGNFFLYHKKTDSKIFFKGENIEDDPNLNNWLGLETNGVFMEQIEELSIKTWNMALTRIGSWYVDNMPKPITLSTFNPTQKWIKQKVHLPYMNGTLPETFYYQLANYQDNAFVTKDQISNWTNTLDERSKRIMLDGDWTNYDNDGNRWAYAYNSERHLTRESQLMGGEVYLSFDFNKNPMSCIVFQTNRFNQIYVHEAIKLPNSDIYEMCQYIEAHYPGRLFIVTGDSSGNARSGLVRDSMTYYLIIQKQLNLSGNQMMIPNSNPSIEKNRVLFNSVLSKGEFKIYEPKCKALIFDLENAAIRADGSLIKQDRNDPTQQLDLLDCARYAVNTFLSSFSNFNY